MNFNLGEVLTRAWQITWKYKILWIFGILAGCGRGGSSFNGSSNGGGGNGGGNGGNNGFNFNLPPLPPQIERLGQQIAHNVVPFVVILVAIICFIFLLAIFLGTIGRIGLIRGTQAADGGAERLGLGQLFSESKPYFWRVLGLSLVVGIPLFLLVMIPLALVLVYVFGQGGQTNPALILGFFSVFIGCMCLLIPVMMVVNLVIRQAESAVVIENLGVFAAVHRGWDVFKKNLGPMILIAIILFLITAAIGILIAIPILLVVVPAFFAFAFTQARNFTPLILALLCLVAYWPISLVANGILTTYSESVWTLTYLRLTQPKEIAPVQLPDA